MILFGDKKSMLKSKKIWWEQTIRYEFSEKVWDNLYINVMKLTNSTKLRIFQYKIINRYLTTNINVARWDKNTSPLCSFCKDNEESLLHLFVQCKTVNKIWSALARWLYYYCNVQLIIEPQVILFNMYKDSFQDMVNTNYTDYKVLHLCAKMFGK